MVFFFFQGNHECRQLTQSFNFKTECEHKFNTNFYETCMEMFDQLPLACIVNRKFLAVHGGISPDLVRVSDIRRISRNHEPPRQGLFCDLLWSDPEEDMRGRFEANPVRGCSYLFSLQACREFLKQNQLISVFRAHEIQLPGYKMHGNEDKKKFPCCMTIFSAPNYCVMYQNKGAIVQVHSNCLNVVQFSVSPHPYHLPKFMSLVRKE